MTWYIKVCSNTHKHTHTHTHRYKASFSDKKSTIPIHMTLSLFYIISPFLSSCFLLYFSLNVCVCVCVTVWHTHIHTQNYGDKMRGMSHEPITAQRMTVGTIYSSVYSPLIGWNCQPLLSDWTDLSTRAVIGWKCQLIIAFYLKVGLSLSTSAVIGWNSLCVPLTSKFLLDKIVKMSFSWYFGFNLIFSLLLEIVLILFDLNIMWI